MKYGIPRKLRSRIRIESPSPEACAYLAEAGLDPGGEPCWIWTGSRNGSGYGQVKHNGRNWLVHKLTYHMRVDKLPLPGQRHEDAEGRLLIGDHLCHTRPCCNPAHQEYITQGENIRRGERHGGRSSEGP